MKAIILAGGRSKRLSELTGNLPKCLLALGHTTIIDNQLDALEKSDIKDIVLITGFGADALEAHVRHGHPNLRFTFVRDEAMKGPAYGLYLAREHLTGPLVYLNADLLCGPEIIQEIATRDRSSTAVQHVDWNEEAVNVILDAQGRVIEIGKHINSEDSQGEYLGATYLDEALATKLARTLESLDYDEKLLFAVDAINLAIKDNRTPLYAHDVSQHPALEIDTPEDYNQALVLWDSISSRG